MLYILNNIIIESTISLDSKTHEFEPQSFLQAYNSELSAKLVNLPKL